LERNLNNKLRLLRNGTR